MWPVHNTEHILLDSLYPEILFFFSVSFLLFQPWQSLKFTGLQVWLCTPQASATQSHQYCHGICTEGKHKECCHYFKKRKLIMILEFWGKHFNNTYSKGMWLKLTLLWPSSSKSNWIKHVIQFFFFRCFLWIIACLLPSFCTSCTVPCLVSGL